ncbi:MAG: DUF805 domain-containing protein [Dehalococcoidia bacterium]|nr:DUF805 domain-containing protein [Dehalococcoidia bacterium]
MTEPQQQPPPSWYHAEGDPDGTTRYWNGTEWVGGPVSAPIPAGTGRSDYSTGTASPPAETGISLDRFFSPSGRVNRRTYAAMWGIGIAAGIVAGILDVFLFGATEVNEAGPAQLICILGLIWPSIATSVKRFHDVGQSGWLVLLQLIPIVGFIIFIYLLVAGGNKHDNQHGPVPAPRVAF